MGVRVVCPYCGSVFELTDSPILETGCAYSCSSCEKLVYIGIYTTKEYTRTKNRGPK